MDFYSELYIDEDIEDFDYILKSIEEKNYIIGVYFLCIDVDSKNLFEILSYREFLFNLKRKKKYLVLGVAKSYYKILDFIKNIFENSISKNLDIKNLKNIILEKNNFVQ